MPFITTGVIAGTMIGIGLSGAATMGAAIAGGVAGAIIGGAAGWALGSWIKGDFDSKEQIPEGQTLPAMQTIQEVDAEQRRKANLMRANRSDTILTSPLGVTAEPKTQKTVLKGALGA